jgi:hypothetical protein
MNSWLGGECRLLTATIVPSWSKPLYTSPNVPCPIRFALLKYLVAKFNSSKLRHFAPCDSDRWKENVSSDELSEVLKFY